MIAPDIETAVAELRALVQAAAVVLPFTGAGISTECGIPDFRSPGGLWTGRGHRALASLYRAGKAPAVVTQNIDNLHQSSGISAEHVIELHGNTTYALCLACGKRYELAWVKQRFAAAGGEAPDCTDCGGAIKSATVSFGQAMPDAAMRRAEELTLACDLFLAVGSSLVVWPAAGFPLLAKRNSARLVIINREATEYDDIADLVIHDDIGATLAPFIMD
jgi:NAD-dependent deacetylase